MDSIIETKYKHSKFLGKYFGSHINIGPITIYGYNAMHFAVNIETRWGYICFHPTLICFGRWWRWYFYISKDATPYNTRLKLGPGLLDT